MAEKEEKTKEWKFWERYQYCKLKGIIDNNDDDRIIERGSYRSYRITDYHPGDSKK